MVVMVYRKNWLWFESVVYILVCSEIKFKIYRFEVKIYFEKKFVVFFDEVILLFNIEGVIGIILLKWLDFKNWVNLIFFLLNNLFEIEVIRSVFEI